MKVPFNGYMGLCNKCFKRITALFNELMNDNWEIKKLLK